MKVNIISSKTVKNDAIIKWWVVYQKTGFSEHLLKINLLNANMKYFHLQSAIFDVFVHWTATSNMENTWEKKDSLVHNPFTTQIGAFLTTCSIFRYISIWYPIHFTKNDANQKNTDINLIPVLKIESRHKRIIARAPMLSRRICSSCISSQLFPEYPDWQRQVYRSAVSRLIHCPPLRHGLSKHSLRSTQLFPSGVTRWPLGQLFFWKNSFYFNVRKIC